MKQIEQSQSVFLFQRVMNASIPGIALQEAREYRLVLDLLFRLLTKDDQRTFSNLYARTQFVFDQYTVPETVQAGVNGLRIFTNQVNNGTVSPEPFLLLAKQTISETISFFSRAAIPPELAETFAGSTEKNWPVFSEKDVSEKVLPIKAIVHEVKENGLLCRDENAGIFFIELPLLERNDLSYLIQVVKPYNTLRIENAGRTDDSGEYYKALPETQIILEPDLLMDISELAECFAAAGLFPLNFLVKKLVPPTFSEAALKGNMVNAIFDAAIRGEHDHIRDVFKEAVAEQVFQAASFGKEALNRMYCDISEHHWRNLIAVAGDIKKKPVRIEPSFFSAKYGLQGRLDVLLEDREDEYRKEIIELKSGRPPEKDTWVNHGMQVIGYNMLLKSAFGEERKGASAILYSAAPQAPLRNVTSNLYMENRLLRVRNQVVAWLMELAQDNFSCLDAITPENTAGLPGFSRNDYAFFHETYSGANEIQRAYYQAFLAFTTREYLQSKCGMFSAPEREEEADGFAALWLTPEEDKVKNFSIIRRLEFVELLDTSYYARFRISEPQHHNFRVGDTVLLYPRRNGKLEPQQQQVVKGRLDAISSEELVLSLNNHQLDASYFSRQPEWILEHDVYESSYWLCTRALFQVLRKENGHRFRLLTGETEPRIGTEAALTVDETLNANQRQLLKDALSAKDYYLLQGPPGTGKTSNMLTRMVKHLFLEQKTTVIVAFTNRAVEEIAEKLEKNNIPFLRMGNRRSSSEQQLRDLCRNGKIDDAASLIRSHKVFLATVATMSARVDQWKAFGNAADTLIVDEASQLTEPQLLPLLMAFPRFILIGDQNQLPPVVAQDPVFSSAKNQSLLDAGIHSLRGSLFERLMSTARRNGWRHAYGMLTTHFRMHEEIAALINHYYAHQLQCGHEDQLKNGAAFHSDESPWSRILSAGRAVFIPSPTEPTSRYHVTEAERVVSLLNALEERYGAAFSPEKVGVVTPWRTQIGLIQSKLPVSGPLRNITIDTVERFQGGENDIIIVSMALYHKAQLQILHSPGTFEGMNGEEQTKIEVDRKLLVTLSRARQQVILLGDENVLSASPHYAAVLSKMKRVELSSVVPPPLF